MDNKSPTPTRRDPFRTALVGLVNAHIAQQGLRPDEAAAVLSEEARDALTYLSKLPHQGRATFEHLTAAAACLVDGRVIPVPGFGILFPERSEI